MIFYLILVVLFTSLFKIGDIGITLTFGDILSFSLMPFFFNELIKGRIKINLFAKWFIAYIIILFFSGVLNTTLFEGQFLNVLKTSLFSWIFFVWIYSLNIRRQLTLRKFLFGVGLLSIGFIIKTWPEMQTAWSQSSIGFTNVNIFSSSLNLNTWGFILLLFIFSALFSFSKGFYKKFSFLVIIVLSILLFFSFSRAAYSLFIVTIIWVKLYIDRVRFLKLLPYAAVLIVLIALSSLDFIMTAIPESALDFFTQKANKADDDLINTRFYLINIKPIIENLDEFNFFQVLFGDGYSIQHSWFSHNLVVTGIIGFIFFLKKFTSGIKQSLDSLKRGSDVVEAKYVILLIFLLLINDFITNISVFLPFAGYLSFILLGYLMSNNKPKIYEE